ncbi:MAG: S41 family peptidase, partial [Pseudomonadota bacterium]
SALSVIIMSSSLSAQEPGSGAAEIEGLTGAKAERIGRLIEVWGFVKYHHADALSGRMAMDQQFFDLYDNIDGAGSMQESDALLADWLDRIGIGEPCNPCAGDNLSEADEIAIIQPTNSWIATLPEPLALRAKAVFENRSSAAANFQIEPARGVRNSQFFNEPDYKATGRDEPALRMLAVARMWNALRYWFPYRDVMDDPVSEILQPAISEVLGAETQDAYKQALARFTTTSDDGHGVIMAYRSAISPSGDCFVPYTWRFVEGQLVVDGLQSHSDGDLRRGDVVRAIAGKSVNDLAEHYGQFLSASNEASRLNVLSSVLMQGECGAHEVSVDRDGELATVSVEWLPRAESGLDFSRGPGRGGETIQALDGGFTYVRFSQLRRSDLDQLVETANAGSGVVLDMRGYPRDFLVFALGGLLIDEPVEFARFTVPSPATPGLFTWTDPIALQPHADGRRISAPVVALIDENAASSPEYHAMAWRAAGVTLIGSPTAGADGNVSTMPLPLDGAGMRYSGIGVFYPDQQPTQRIGIVPDIMVKPTIEGISAGRDEPLERALEELRSMKDEQP